MRPLHDYAHEDYLADLLALQEAAREEARRQARRARNRELLSGAVVMLALLALMMWAGQGDLNDALAGRL